MRSQDVAGPSAPKSGPTSTVVAPLVEPRPPLPAVGPATPSSRPGELRGEGAPGRDNIDHDIRMRAIVEMAALWKWGHLTTDEFYAVLNEVVR